jgi:hypothetical protein
MHHKKEKNNYLKLIPSGFQPEGRTNSLREGVTTNGSVTL